MGRNSSLLGGYGDDLLPAVSNLGLNMAAISPPGRVYFVDPQNGAAGNNGLSWDAPFAAFSSLNSILDDGDTIMFRGVFRGNWTAPQKNDVTLIGVGNQPRQATSDGVPNGGGATWLSLASPAVDNLLKVIGQGWRIENIFFNNADTTKADVWLHRNESLGQDASHAIINNCVFTGTCYGIKQSGGVAFVKVLNSRFFGFAGSGDTAIASETGTGDGTGQQWEIAYCRFIDNVHNIVVPFNVANIHDNIFVVVGQSVTSTSVINCSSGANNIIADNVIGRVSNASPNTTLFVTGTNDIWANNKMSDTAKYGIPGNS